MSIRSRLRAKIGRTATDATLRGGQRTHGWTNVGDSGPAIPLTLADTHYKLTNDGLLFQDTRFAIYPDCPLWDTSTQQFDFSCLAPGDEVKLTCTLEVVQVGGGQKEIIVFFRGRMGTPSEFTVGASPASFRGSGNKGFYTFEIEVTMDDQEMLDNAGQLEVAADDTGMTVNLYNFKPFVTLISGGS